VGARLLGPADQNETLSITIVLRRRSDGPPLPGFSDFRALGPRRRLSADDFAAKYGASSSDIDQVVQFCKANGLVVIETNAARRTVVASGTAAQMQKAFAITLERYEHTVVRRRGAAPRLESYRGRNGFIHMPSGLVEIVIGIFGLDNRRIIKRNSADPPGTQPLAISTITRLYNFPTNSASGQTIGILSESGFRASDINDTFSGSPPRIIEVPVDGGNDGEADAETTQDICIAAAAAPGAAIAVYFTSFSQKGWLDLIHRVAHPNVGDPVCSVLSSSFYVADGDDADTLNNEGIGTGWLTASSQAFQDAAIQGVTVCVASGDTGSSSKVGGGDPANWGLSFGADGEVHVQYPASDPWVLSVGGTTIGKVSGSSFDEFVWNDPDPSDAAQWGTTGGGVSAFFPLPSYQSEAGVPRSLNDNHVGRGVPDVAANASLHSGYSGIIVDGSPFIGNGTSTSAPLWAGLVAVMNAALGENLGFVNTVLYHLGPGAFRDISPGAGPGDNSNSGIPGYPAGQGWDACTGLGSINGTALLVRFRAERIAPLVTILESCV
jgi:kumamolisin